jgi:hypothetical protein
MKYTLAALLLLSCGIIQAANQTALNPGFLGPKEMYTTTGGGSQAGIPATISKLAGSVTVNSTNLKDTLQISGVLPNMPAGFSFSNPNNQFAIIRVNGVGAGLTLNAKGQDPNRKGVQFKVVKEKNGVLNVTFKVNSKGNLTDWIEAAGVNPAMSVKNAPFSVDFSLEIADLTYVATFNGTYTTVANKTVKFK